MTQPIKVNHEWKFPNPCDNGCSPLEYESVERCFECDGDFCDWCFPGHECKESKEG